MTKERKKQVIRDTLRKNRLFLLLLFFMPVTFLTVFLLYGILIEALLYGTALILFLALNLLIPDIIGEMKRAEEREKLLCSLPDEWASPLDLKTLADQDWHRAVLLLGKRAEQMSDCLSESRKDTLDYVSAWVHQIKTPIAVMRMLLENVSGPEQTALQSELSRTEQYVEMVLQYARLESESNDLVIEAYPLDELIRDSIRRFSRQFILKKLSLSYDGTDLTVITDRKWFCCILDQLLSNAVKYTAHGKVTVQANPITREICISDTGIGIPECDQPRIFEKGYTGQNGRRDAASSGLGLYLSKRAAALLHVSLRVESTPGRGSRFFVSLPETER